MIGSTDVLRGTMVSRLEGNARIWTLTVPRAPRAGELVDWSEPPLGSVPACEDRGWITSEESSMPGTVIMHVRSGGTRWTEIRVQQDHVTERDADGFPLQVIMLPDEGFCEMFETPGLYVVDDPQGMRLRGVKVLYSTYVSYLRSRGYAVTEYEVES